MTANQIRLMLMILFTAGLPIYQFIIIRRLTNNLIRGERQFNKLHEATEYLLEVIDANNIELTEFDLIALTTISEDD